MVTSFTSFDVKLVNIQLKPITNNIIIIISISVNMHRHILIHHQKRCFYSGSRKTLMVKCSFIHKVILNVVNVWHISDSESLHRKAWYYADLQSK